MRGFMWISSICNSMFMIQTEEEKEAAEKNKIDKENLNMASKVLVECNCSNF